MGRFSFPHHPESHRHSHPRDSVQHPAVDLDVSNHAPGRVFRIRLELGFNQHHTLRSHRKDGRQMRQNFFQAK
jgi:hypothetical protein